jgi:hypothetical protein
MDGRVVLIILVAIVAGWLWFRHRHGASGRAEAELQKICLGNEAQAERLIAAEVSRAPGISRAEAAMRAVERYRRDNR